MLYSQMVYLPISYHYYMRQVIFHTCFLLTRYDSIDESSVFIMLVN